MFALLVASSLAGPALLDAGELPALELHAGKLDTLVRYDIDQAIDDVSGTFDARVKITWTNPSENPVGRLPLRLHPNAPAEFGTLAPRIKVDALTADRDISWELVSPTNLEVAFDRTVEPGETVVIDVRYHGKMDHLDGRANDPLTQAMAQIGSIGGLPTGDYGLLAEGDGLFVMATTYPMVAPWREGDFDVSGAVRVGDVAYNAMARFDVRTVVGPDVNVVTNLADYAIENRPSGRVVKSKGDGVRDLVIVGGRDLVKSSTRVGHTTVNSWYRPRDEAAGQRALDMAAASLGSYEKRFGSYPYSELDVAEATLVGGAGGVEFCGLVLVAGMLYRDPAESQAELAELMKMWGALGGALGTLDGTAAVNEATGKAIDDALEFTVAHEVAHQWFAGIVGNDSQRSPTLDEPLAQYLAGLAMEDRYGADAGVAAMERYAKLNYVLWRALGGSDRVVRRDASTYTTNAEYAALVYGKAPYAWTELRAELGDDALNGALRSAVDTYRFDLVSTEQFVGAVDKAANGKVAPTVWRYLDEVHGDEDLNVVDPGDLVLKLILPPETYAQLDRSLAVLGLQRDDFVRMLFGGAIASDAPVEASPPR